MNGKHSTATLNKMNETRKYTSKWYEKIHNKIDAFTFSSAENAFDLNELRAVCFVPHWLHQCVLHRSTRSKYSFHQRNTCVKICLQNVYLEECITREILFANKNFLARFRIRQIEKWALWSQSISALATANGTMCSIHPVTEQIFSSHEIQRFRFSSSFGVSFPRLFCE